MLSQRHRSSAGPAGQQQRRGRGRTNAPGGQPPTRALKHADRTASGDQNVAQTFAQFARLYAGQYTKVELEACWASMCTLFVAATAGSVPTIPVEIGGATPQHDAVYDLSEGPSCNESAGPLSEEVAASRWLKYPPINDADLEQVEKIHRELQLHDMGGEFVALEKVHGSHFAFETDGRGITYFSRKQRLERKEPFVCKTAPQDAMQQYHAAVMKAFRACNEAVDGGVRSVVVYGEYFGGWYPHEDVKQEGPGAGAAVQKGVVAYAPAHHFFAYDVCVDRKFLDFNKASLVLSQAGFPLVATPIIRGTFAECMAFDVETLRTTIPGRLGLPLCEPFSIAEGLVVKPVLRCEARMVKRKSMRYLEACPAELQKWIRRCVASQEEAFEKLYLCMCRRPRLDAVLSKEPQLREDPCKSLPRVQHLFRKDLEEALRKKLGTSGTALPEDRLQRARAEADKRIAAWLFLDEHKGG